MDGENKTKLDCVGVGGAGIGRPISETNSASVLQIRSVGEFRAEMYF